jgi:hypothetical protein
MKYVAYGYPLNPTTKQKKYYKRYFKLFAYVLPCEHCRFHYKIAISKGPYKLTKLVFDNRNNLTKWLYDIHNYVNEKLGKICNKTYQEVCDEIEFDRPDVCNL